LVGRRRLLLALLIVAVARAGAPAEQPSISAGSSRKPPPVTSAGSAAIERRLSEAVRLNPDSFDAHYQLASFYLQQGKLAAALPHLERACAIDPTHYASGYDLALALIETRQLEEARKQIAQMMRVSETAELHNLLGNIEERAGNLVPAAEEYQRAAHMTPTEEHLFDWGNNLLQLRAFEEASQVFSAAIARHPRSARLHIGLGTAHYARGQYEDAIKSFCQAADLAPSDPRPYQFLGEMYGVAPALSGEVTGRLARFAKAHPRNALAQFHYAMSLWKGQAAEPADLRQTEALLRRAVALDRRLAKGLLELGILLSDEQRYKEAIQELQSAIRLEPDLAQAHYRLAQAYQRTGQKALAAKELEIFERLNAQTSRNERHAAGVANSRAQRTMRRFVGAAGTDPALDASVRSIVATAGGWSMSAFRGSISSVFNPEARSATGTSRSSAMFPAEPAVLFT
jgi:tetratricopeptide (TPR) repeat protein